MCLTMTISCGIWETLVGSKYTVYLPWESFVPGSADKAGNVEEGATTISLLVFFSYIIIFNTVVPISLYVRYVSLFTQKKSSTTRSSPSLSLCQVLIFCLQKKIIYNTVFPISLCVRYMPLTHC